MDGYRLAQRFKEREETSGANFIALTGYGQAHDRVLSKAAGFAHHFVKPLDTQELERVLSRLEP
jgi:CheY-like chemotaxis protein